MFLGSYNYHRLQRSITWRYFDSMFRTELTERTNIAVSNTDKCTHVFSNSLSYLYSAGPSGRAV